MSGHFVGKGALAAVGICNPITTLMILFLNGLCMGASILMGMQYGARDYDTLERQISTTLLSGVVFSLHADRRMRGIFAVTDPAAYCRWTHRFSGNDASVSADYFLADWYLLFYTTFFQAPFEHWGTAVLRCIF